MLLYKALLLVHITSFALWLGVVTAALLVIRTLESRLTDSANFRAGDEQLLRGYIRKEVKLVDVVFLLLIFSGILLAQFFIGWTTWVIIKIGLLVAQFIATMGYIRLYIRPITYPAPPNVYRRWYGLVAVSLTFFAVILLVVFFGR
ncbi:MAG: hypothetical protein IPM39_22325 [Chloroflexi bacterium]|nr:hypothetical protein [Chloroflexota bacterium]